MRAFTISSIVPPLSSEAQQSSAHDMPAPKAKPQTRSPFPTRPAATASASAIGMPAAAM